MEKRNMTFQKTQIDNGLIWITGYSGAGKSTIARLATEKLKEMGIPVVLLDGDDLRSILGERFGHDLDDRRQLAYVYSRLCQRISGCGVTVVIATIAMFESVRVENRASNENYLEVYLDVPLAVREERDPKGLYKAAMANIAHNVSFLSGLEEPVNPDLVIENYGEMSPGKAASIVVAKYCAPRAINGNALDTKISDKEIVTDPSFYRSQYWDSYYKKRKAPINPSSFALFCNENYLANHCHVLEFGCGNGRDAFYFAKTHRVTAIDESRVVVEVSRTRATQESVLNLDFLHGEFGCEVPGLPNEVDAVYGRFVIHAMPEDAEARALRESWRLLRNGGRLFLEFRTTRDPLMSEGTQLGRVERITDHYRRFIEFDELCTKLSRLGFSLDLAIEKKGLAINGSDDPVVGRIVATKRL
jgi:adenylylsulfate kinase-like enzyme/SAM-dependent methyltransferase